MIKVITDRIEERVELSSDEKEIIKYQLRMIISEYMMFLFMLVVTLMFGKHIEFILAYGSMRLSRTYIGGIHQDSYWKCCIHTIMFFSSVLLCENYLNFLQFEVIFPIFLVVDMVFAPLPSKERGEYGLHSKKE